MTLWMNRDGQTVTIHGNIGLRVSVYDSRVSEWSVSEHVSHLRHFWGELGRMLDEAESTRANDAEKARLADSEETPETQ
jgi:hypothetical protein